MLSYVSSVHVIFSQDVAFAAHSEITVRECLALRTFRKQTHNAVALEMKSCKSDQPIRVHCKGVAERNES